MAVSGNYAGVKKVDSKPMMTMAQIFNMSMGFLGIQFGFALQNGNASRILTDFGANVENLSWFWLVAPIAGMIVQPIIGFYSDKTWTSLGRRKPFFLAGAILASFGLMLMPNAGVITKIGTPLFVGAAILMIMDVSFNIAMEPFRALVADNLPDRQRNEGFAIQTFLIGVGAVVGSWLPWIFHNWFGVSNVALPGHVAYNVTLSFYVGAVIFLLAILWTVTTTKEFPPEEHKKFAGEDPIHLADGSLDSSTHARPKVSGFQQIASDFVKMPATMKQLGLTQFFSWFALFSMWVFTTPAVVTHVYGLTMDDKSPLRQDAGDWVGIIFGVYNGVSALYALCLPRIAKKIGRKSTHAFSLVCGGLGLISMYFIHDKNILLISMIGVGMAWASILAMPYAILAGSIPAHKMGLYMGIFNFFITLPQIVNGVIGGPIVKNFYGGQSIFAIVVAGLFMFLAAASVMVVKDTEEQAA
jgi:maltose/moltooligosaccharide transporter